MAPNTNPLGISTFIRQCARKHCTNPAQFLPVIRIPAQGMPVAEHEPIAVLVDVSLCEHCCNKVNVGEFLSKPLRKRVKEQCRKLRKVAPDFNRAFLQKKPLNE